MDLGRRIKMYSGETKLFHISLKDWSVAVQQGNTTLVRDTLTSLSVDLFSFMSFLLLTLGRRVTVVVLSFYLSIYLSTALQRAALTSSRQLRYEQAKHVDGLQSDGWILLKCFRSRVMAAGSP